MELNLDDLSVGKNVKCVVDGDRDSLKAGSVVDGNLIGYTYTTNVSKDGINNIITSINVDVVDPVNGGIHHLTVNKVYSVDEDSKTIEEISKKEEIVFLETRLQIVRSELENEKLKGGS